MKLHIRQTAHHQVYIVKDIIEIETDDFPNLRGLTQEQAIKCIQTQDLSEVYPQVGTQWDTYNNTYKMSISDIIEEQEAIQENIYDSKVVVEVVQPYDGYNLVLPITQ